MAEFLLPFLRSRTGQFTDGTINLAWPGLKLVGDVAILIVECSGDDATLDLASQGFAHIDGSPFVDVADNTGSKLQILWHRLTTTSLSNITHGDIGDHCFVELLVLGRVKSDGDPWNDLAVTIKSTASTNYTFPSVAAPTDDSYILMIGSHPLGGSNIFGAPTNASLEDITERRNTYTSEGNGGGVAVFDAVAPVLGPVGPSSGTLPNASTNVLVTLAFRRIPKPFPYWRILTTYVAAAVPTATVQIAEIEFREAVGGSDWATGGTPFATSTGSGSNAANAFDNSTSTNWFTTTALPQAVGYFLAAGRLVNEVAITSGDTSDRATRAPTNFTVQHSENNSTWTDYWEVTGEPSWGITETRYYVGPQDTVYEPPDYDITPDVTEADEGDTITYTTTGPDGTVYWRLVDVAGNCTASDLVGNQGSGEVEIVGGTAEFALTLKDDLVTEGAETLAVELVDELGVGATVLATADTVAVADTSTSAEYDWSGTTDVAGTPVVGETGSASEGQVVTVLITADPIPPAGTRLAMEVIGTVDGSDYTITGSSDWVEFNGVSGAVSWSITLDEDVTTEGPETLQIRARTGWPATDGDIIYTSPAITVADTSQAAPTYAVTPDDTTVNEGETVIFDVGCTTVPPGTILYWTITGDLDAADVVGGALSGTVEIDTGDILVSSGQFSITLASDLTTEGVETFAVEIRTGSVAGPVVATSATITVADTSVTPPEYAVTAGASSVPEGGTVSFAVTTNWFTGDTLYWTLTGTAGGADFTSGISGSVAVSETVYPEKTGSVDVTVAYDELIEGTESFTFHLRTGSTGGPIVATAGPVTIIDEAYTVTPNRRLITEGDTVAFAVAAINANPTGTLYWTVAGTIDTDDVVGGALSGSVSLTGGEGTISIALAVDLITDGAEYFYLELRRGSISGEILAVSPAVVVRESIIDYDAWLGTLDGVRILLVEMDHSAGTVYFGNYPYTSRPGDTNPNRPYDDTLRDAVDIETRIDGGFTLGEVTVVNDGRHDAWVTYDWHGYPIRFLMGEPGWSLDDFRLVALATNGGLAAVERGLLSFGIYDAKAIFAQPLQTTLLADGNPVPVAVGKPFNVAPPLISVPDDEYRVHEGAIVSVTPRDNGADVASADNLAGGTFELSAAPQGTVTADVETSITTPTAIIAWVCDRYGVSVDGDTLDALPAYEIGLFYGSQATGADVLTHVCQSIGGYWLRGADGEVEVYILDEPAVTADLELDYQTEIAEGGLRLVAMEEPVKTLTLNYRRNWAPQARDSIAGSVLTGDPAFADALTKEWRQIAVTNAVADHPLAQDAVMDTYLVDSLDAYAEANRVAGLRAVRRERWEVECFLAQAAAQVGKTVKITYPAWGFESGRNARIVAVSRQLSRGRVTLEVWL